jgi:hypothetical protein
MPVNCGIAPPAERVDIVYRNGVIERDVLAAQRRWSVNDPDYPPNYDFDIQRWQRVGAGGKST